MHFCDRRRVLQNHGIYAKSGLIRVRIEDIFEWEQKEIENEIINYRLAIKDVDTLDSRLDLSCRIFTNLGNLFSKTGRFVEAIEYFDRALNIDLDFAEAIGNKGICLSAYANVLYDCGHANYLQKYAHECLSRAIEFPLPGYTHNGFKEHIEFIESQLSPSFLSEDIDMDNFDIGDSEQEIDYRKWCLKNRLFLNPLNDLGPYAIAARDIFVLSPINPQTCYGPVFLGHYSQMKQEFISARYLYYQGIRSKHPHFSDKGTFLYDTLDFPVYSLAIEKVKNAFRVAYSLFDKISFFLDYYYDLSIKDSVVNFRNVWYKKLHKENGLRLEFQKCTDFANCSETDKCQFFQQYKNWPLRGLFWLSKDLREKDFTDSIEPDARELDAIRNHLEHKYLKIHEDQWVSINYNHFTASGAKMQGLSMSRKDFEAKTLRILKLARAGLLYLSLAVNIEEANRKRQFKFKQAPLIQLGIIDDERKI